MIRRLLPSLVAVLCLTGWSAEAAEPFDYFANNWNVVGLKDYERGARVTPDNQILLAGTQTAVQVRFGQNLTPLSRRQGKLAHDGWMPIMEIAACDGSVRYEFTYWAAPMPTVKDWQKAFDGPIEGENFLVWVRYKAVNQSNEGAAAKIDIGLNPKPDPRPNVEDTAEPVVDNSLHGHYAVAKELPPGGMLEGAARFAFFPIKDAASLDAADHQLWFNRTVEYWQGFEKSAATIEVPCRKAVDALKAAHVCQMIASDHGELHAGEGFYDAYFIRDAAYQILELEEAGLMKSVGSNLERCLRCQRPDGQFVSQENELDGNGQAIWMLWKYYQMTQDRAWLEKAYPAMCRAAEWTKKTRREAPGDSPYAGLLPGRFADGECLYDGKHHIVGYDLWNLRGIECVVAAAQALDRDDEAKQWQDEAQAYRAAIDAACQRTGVPYFPPSWEKDGTPWGDTETLWPTELFAADDPRVTATIDYARRLFEGGFQEGTIRWYGGDVRKAIHPYMSMYTTMASLIRGDDEQVVEDFYWYLLHSTAAHAFPEGIFFVEREAWSNTIPHALGAANFAILLRHMLVHERGDELHLLPAVPDWWLEDGQVIRVERAPTHFGPISLTIRGTASGVTVAWDPPSRQTPKRTVLHLPKSRPLTGSLAGVEVVTRADQKQRWDFPTMVSLYRKYAPKISSEQEEAPHGVP